MLVRIWLYRLLLAFTVLISLSYLLVCLVPYINTADWWFVGMLGLAFPALLLLMFLCVVIWMIRRIRWGLVLLTIFLLGWQQIFALVGMNFLSKEFALEKQDGTLRILCWNVSRLDESNKHLKDGVSYRALMLDAIMQQDADVLCLQEFIEPRDNQVFSKNIQAFEQMGYPYHFYYPSSVVWEGALSFGMIIFSRFPIEDTASFTFGPTQHSEGLIYADIKIKDRKVRVFSTHMESPRSSNYGYLGSPEEGFSGRKVSGVLGGMKRGYFLRNEQAELVKGEVLKSPYPVILAGDLGDIPNSSAYFTVKGRLKDAFLEKGSGLGATFRFLSPTLRVDYVFADPSIRVLQYFRPSFVYSDHYPLVVDVAIGDGK